MVDEIGDDATFTNVALRLGPGTGRQDNGDMHTHILQRDRRQADQEQKHNRRRQSGDDVTAALAPTCETEGEVAHAPQGQKGPSECAPAQTTFLVAGTALQERRPHPRRIRAPLPAGGQAEDTVRIPEPGADAKCSQCDASTPGHSISDRTLLAGRRLVSPARLPPEQPRNDAAPERGEALEPKKTLLTALGMGLTDALRKAEEENGIPPAAGFARRLSKGTQERCNSGWRRLRDLANESPDVLQQIANDGPQTEMLATLLAHLAEKPQSTNKSASAHAMAAAAVSHHLQASDPSPRTILTNTNKAHRRARPSVAKNDTVPDLHKMIDVIREVGKGKDEKAKRDHLAFLLMVLTGGRASDTVRTWRHGQCLRFSISKLDTPGWAREHRSEAGETLRKLGWLPENGDGIAEKEFTRVELRAYMGKTCQPTGTRCDPWVALTENRFCLDLCPILATARHLQLTGNHKIETKLRCDQHTVIDNITDPGGRTKIVAKPLLTSANGRIRSGLQSATLRSRSKKTILTPLGAPNTPHAMRAAVTSYKAACGVPINVVKMTGNWTSAESFEKHHYRVLPTPVNPLRVRDATFHDWTLMRAHVLSKRSLPPLDPTDTPDTSNDQAIARAFSLQAMKDARSATRRRRGDHQHAR